MLLLVEYVFYENKFSKTESFSDIYTYLKYFTIDIYTHFLRIFQ